VHPRFVNIFVAGTAHDVLIANSLVLAQGTMCGSIGLVLDVGGKEELQPTPKRDDMPCLRPHPREATKVT
jgi:hypothetical protein